MCKDNSLNYNAQYENDDITFVAVTSVYHITLLTAIVLFHTSKTAKMIKAILLRAPCQNVNVLLWGKVRNSPEAPIGMMSRR